MIEQTQNAPKASGLQTVLNTIAAPKEAFETLRVAPTWGWAMILTLVLAVAASFLMLPAMHHATDASWPQTVASNPSLSGMSDVKLAQVKSVSDAAISFSPVLIAVFLAIGMLIQTIVMMIFNALGRGTGTFKSYWAAAWNIAVPSAGIGSLILAVIVMLRGVDSFMTQNSVQGAMPSLALLLPHAGKLTNLLTAVTPFSLWAAWLIVLAMVGIGRASRGMAWAAGIVSLLLPALFTLLTPAAK